MRRTVVLLVVLSWTIAVASSPGPVAARPSPVERSGRAGVAVTNHVVSSPVPGGGFPTPDGVPVPGTCGPGRMNSNRSESWLAVEPGTEDLVGVSKFFFDRYSTFYNFYLGSYTIQGSSVSNNIVQGYDCTTTGTQEMPPTWTNSTDPNVDFDTKGRAYQVVLPFNAYWTNMHPNGAIDVSYSDDLGKHWVKGNGGRHLEHSPNQSTFAAGGFEDKQWVAVNHIPGNRYQDHVYAAWTVFDGHTSKLKIAVSRDRGRSFSKATVLTEPSISGPSNFGVYPSIDAAGTVYVAFAAYPACCASPATIWVARSTDDGRTWGRFSRVATTDTVPGCCLPNTSFRDGIVESFAASPTHPGHLYVAWESWDGTQMDVKFSQSVDGGGTWSAPVVVNRNVDPPGSPTDQFQPEVAAGPDGGVAVAWYDRRRACPSDPSILPRHVGASNVCIDTFVQAYRDDGAGAVAVGPNVRMTDFTWDPEQPAQEVGGLGQMACAGHTDPCTVSFIGDYFGLAVSAENVYALFVSTHYPSTVRADGGGPVYYQQQVLATASRSALGI
jgi:hypothetical protein